MATNVFAVLSEKENEDNEVRFNSMKGIIHETVKNSMSKYAVQTKGEQGKKS